MNYMAREDGKSDERFLAILSGLSSGSSSRKIYAEILDSVIAATEALIALVTAS